MPNVGFGGGELFVLVVLAIIIVGPKDLPKMMRTLGRVIGQARSMAKDFQRSFDEMGREVELQELRDEINTLKSANPMADVQKEMRGVEKDLRAPDEIKAAKIKAAADLDADQESANSIAPPRATAVKPEPKIKTGAPEDE
tara:strand:- start:244 stop:666 length:423 start_codon:yes stop_codon:yes gene_type:complete